MKNSILPLNITNPELVNEWDYEKNEKMPSNYTYRADVKVWWICKNGHSYQALIGNRTNEKNKTGCPYCSNKKAWKGFNDLQSSYPDIAEEWDYEKNNMKPDEVLAYSHVKAWFKCSKYNHSYETYIYSRTSQHIGCPYCSNKKTLTGFNDIATTNTDILKYWDYEKNTIQPTDVRKSYHDNVYFKCDKMHSFMMTIKNFIKRKTEPCPYCSNRKLLPGYNDVNSMYPFLSKDFSKSNLKPASSSLANSSAKYIWKCENNHEWITTIYERTIAKSKCPYCSNQKVYKGFNDLQSSYPDIAEEWDYEKNSMKPDEILYSSNKKIYWICSQNCNHKWKTSVYIRTKIKCGCPKCACNTVSKQENMLADELCKLLPDLADEIKDNRNKRVLDVYDDNGMLIGSKKKEVDIMIPYKHIAIEYNGDYWHSDVMIQERFNNTSITSADYDRFKQRACEQIGYNLIIVKEHEYMNDNQHDNIMKSLIKDIKGY